MCSLKLKKTLKVIRKELNEDFEVFDNEEITNKLFVKCNTLSKIAFILELNQNELGIQYQRFPDFIKIEENNYGKN